MTRPTAARRLGALATVLTALAAVVGFARVVDLAGATAEFRFTRFAGQDRFETAVLIARERGTAPTVLLARANPGQPQAFADALAGNYLAGFLQSPILLTNTESLPQPTRDGLNTLGTNRVVILGGPEAVSTAVENELKARAGTTVERVGGVDRFATAAAIATADPNRNVGTVAGRRTAIVTTGVNFPDPLTAGPAAYADRFPILLSLPTTLPAPSRQALSDLAIDNVIIVGGPEAVSPTVEAEIQQARPGATVQRIGGVDRHETASLFADFEVQTLGFSTTHVNLARSDDFPDALAGGPHGGRERAAILLTPSGSAHPVTCTWLGRHAATLTSGHIYGGEFAVSQTAQSELERCAGGTGATTTSTPTTSTTIQPTPTATPTVTVITQGNVSTVTATLPDVVNSFSITVSTPTAAAVHGPPARDIQVVTVIELPPGAQPTGPVLDQGDCPAGSEVNSRVRLGAIGVVGQPAYVTVYATYTTINPATGQTTTTTTPLVQRQPVSPGIAGTQLSDVTICADRV